MLGGKGKVVNGGVGLLSCVGTEVYRERRGGGNSINTQQIMSNTMHNMAIRGVRGDLTQCRVVLVKENNNRESIPGVVVFGQRDRRGTVACLLC